MFAFFYLYSNNNGNKLNFVYEVIVLWRAGMKWILLILGSLIGAGYASGQEIWQFFGAESGLAIVLFTIMFIFSSYIVMKISFKVQSTHFLPVLEHLMGCLLLYPILSKWK